VVRLKFAEPGRRWRAWLPPIAWVLVLAAMPWWTGLPLLLGLAAIRAGRLPRLQRYDGVLGHALRWGFAGWLIAGLRRVDDYRLGLIGIALAALAGFSLLALLESWLARKPRLGAAADATIPEWRELALAPIGPAGSLIELQAPTWIALDGGAADAPDDVRMDGASGCTVGALTRIDNVQPLLCVAPGMRWLAWPMAARRGVVLYDRTHDKQYRLRGWQLYGWHAEEAWLSRSEEQPPLALSHVLGQDQREE
jgi:hypothetical protein